MCGTKCKRPSFKDKMDKALEEMFRAGTQFCRLQKLALEVIIKHESPILVVMGTRVGKSMLFQILAKSVSSRTTIVITLLVSLQSHIVEQCQQQLGTLSMQEVQMVFLTATLLKHTEPKFMQIMKIKPEEVQTF
ncbi:hypothetical protein VF21_10393 [Pseudogymnoascus sp. 05NY08]|nr:hypothetical protein VF21_10393 [Pseudogymnoascus sp. 05NY08]